MRRESETGEERGVVEQAFGAHDAVCAGRLQAGLDILLVEHVAIREDRHGNGLFDHGDLLPVCEALYKDQYSSNGRVNELRTEFTPR